jgi:hypothetical protein
MREGERCGLVAFELEMSGWRKLLELANAVEPVQHGRSTAVHLNQLKGTPAEYKAGLDLALEGWL